MRRYVFIDPGTIQSAYCSFDVNESVYLEYIAKIDNEELLKHLREFEYNKTIIEGIVSYGMPVGQSVIETCYFIGRVQEIAYQYKNWNEFYRYSRKEIKQHICNSTRAKDSNVVQALIDRFAKYPDVNHGKGNKRNPDFFAGFTRDIWQAFALSVFYFDTIEKKEIIKEFRRKVI